MRIKPCSQPLRPAAFLFILPALSASSVRPSSPISADALCNSHLQCAGLFRFPAVCAPPRGSKCNSLATSSSAPVLGAGLPVVILAPPAPQSPVIAISTTISSAFCTRFNRHWPVPPAGGVHQGGNAALSCRLCLIACNSRKFTRGQALTLSPVPEEGFSGDR